MCGLYKNLFRHFLKEQANEIVDCHNYNLRLDPPPPPPLPEIKDEQAARRPKRIKFGGEGRGGSKFSIVQDQESMAGCSCVNCNKQKGHGRKNGLKLYKFKTNLFFYNKNTLGNNIIKDVLAL